MICATLLADKEVPQDDPSNGKKASSASKSQLKPPATVDYGDEDEEDGAGGSQSLFWRHFAALSIKRFHHSRRNKKGMLCEVSSVLKFIIVQCSDER